MNFCSDLKSFRSPAERPIIIAVSARLSPCLLAQNNENHLKNFYEILCLEILGSLS